MKQFIENPAIKNIEDKMMKNPQGLRKIFELFAVDLPPTKAKRELLGRIRQLLVESKRRGIHETNTDQRGEKSL